MSVINVRVVATRTPSPTVKVVIMVMKLPLRAKYNAAKCDQEFLSNDPANMVLGFVFWC